MTGFLHAAVGILLQAIADLREADRGYDDEFATAGLLIAGRERVLAQRIELILVETALQPQQQPVIALARRIDRLLVDQHGIDDAAHLDKLLRVTAVAGKPRHLPRCHRTDLAEADLGDHPGRNRRAPRRQRPKPRSSSIVSMRDQPSAVRRSHMAY